MSDLPENIARHRATPHTVAPATPPSTIQPDPLPDEGLPVGTWIFAYARGRNRVRNARPLFLHIYAPLFWSDAYHCQLYPCEDKNLRNYYIRPGDIVGIQGELGL